MPPMGRLGFWEEVECCTLAMDGRLLRLAIAHPDSFAFAFATAIFGAMNLMLQKATCTPTQLQRIVAHGRAHSLETGTANLTLSIPHANVRFHSSLPPNHFSFNDRQPNDALLLELVQCLTAFKPCFDSLVIIAASVNFLCMVLAHLDRDDPEFVESVWNCLQDVPGLSIPLTPEDTKRLAQTH